LAAWEQTRYVSNRKVIGNIIVNGIGAPNGAYNPWGTLAEGIFYDNGAMNIETTGNTVFNVSNIAMQLNGAKNIKISGNTFYSPNQTHAGMQQKANRPQIRNNSIYNNIFFMQLTNEAYFVRQSQTNDVNLFASISGNYYARPLDGSTSSVHSKVKAIDRNAKFKDYKSTIRTLFNASKSSKSFRLDATYVDAKGVTRSGSITLQPYASTILIKSGSSRSSDTQPIVSITSPTTDSSIKGSASLNIAASATDADGSITKVEFYNGTTLLQTVTSAPYTWTWSNVVPGSYTLTAIATDNSGKVATSSPVKISVLAISNTIDSTNLNKVVVNEVGRKAFNFKLFPNPAINKIQVNFKEALNNEKGSFSIVNMSGSVIRNIPVVLSGKTMEIDVSTLSSGTYTLRLVKGNVVSSEKFIKIY